MTGLTRFLSLIKSYPVIALLVAAIVACLIKLDARQSQISALERKLATMYTAETAAQMCSKSVDAISARCSARVEAAISDLKQPAPDVPAAKSAEEFNAWLKGL